MQTSEVLRSYYSRVVPVIPELFNMAHAICGNYDLAEYALQYTLIEAWIGESHGGMGFREGLRNILRRVAAEEALGPRNDSVEFTWHGLAAEDDEPVLLLLSQESAEVRRMVALRYGCALSAGRIAKLMAVSAGHVREMLDRFERRVSRKLTAGDRRKCELIIARTVRREFGRVDEAMPSLSAIYRSFETEAAETRKPDRKASRIVRRCLTVLLALLCAATFWFAAVLIRPVPMEEPVQETVEEAESGEI